MLGLAILKSNPTISKRTTPDTHLSYFSCCDNKILKESNCISYFPVAVTKHRDPKRQRKQTVYFGLQFQRDKLPLWQVAGRCGSRQAWWREQEPQAGSRYQLEELWGFTLSKLTPSHMFTPARGHFLTTSPP